MGEQIIWALLAGLMFGVLLLAVLGIKLWHELKKLQKDIAFLRSQLQRSNDDVAGLCSAAVSVDKRLSSNELDVSRIMDYLQHAKPANPEQSHAMVVEPEPETATSQGYNFAIEKIRNGASLDDLVKSCGLTRDEAVLLMRLHSNTKH